MKSLTFAAAAAAGLALAVPAYADLIEIGLQDPIVNGGAITTLLSPQDTASCVSAKIGYRSGGCNGGYMNEAWSYFQKTGVVSGGNWSAASATAADTCWPYELQRCNHHVADSSCAALSFATPTCKAACTTLYSAKTFAADKRKSASAFSVAGVAAAMKEIYANGPITAGFTVYDDFLSYSSGVYHHVTGAQLGGHAVKVIGWGQTLDATPVKYWVAINSWNDVWGDKGYFKILRGTNDCGFESSFTAGNA